MKPFEYEIGQRVRMNDGVEGFIARKTKLYLKTGWTFSYAVVEANGDLVGDGKLLFVDSFIPIGGPGPKPIFDDGSRQSLIPGMELLVSDKAKKRQRAA